MSNYQLTSSSSNYIHVSGIKIQTNSDIPVLSQMQPAMSSDVVVLKRQLGLWSCVGLVVGNIIGSGIFISPKGILANTGESVGWALVVWIACGVISMLGALCMAELGTTFPRSSGDFMYIMIGFNKLLAFLRVFTYIFIVRPAATAVVSMTMGQYILAPLFPDCIVPQMAVKLLAALALCK